MTWRLRIHGEIDLTGALLLTAGRINIKVDNGQSMWQQESIMQAQQQAGEVRPKQLPVFLMFASSFKSKRLVESQLCHLQRIHCKEPMSLAGQLAQALSSKGTFPKPAFSVLTIILYYYKPDSLFLSAPKDDGWLPHDGKHQTNTFFFCKLFLCAMFFQAPEQLNILSNSPGGILKHSLGFVRCSGTKHPSQVSICAKT